MKIPILLITFIHLSISIYAQFEDVSYLLGENNLHTFDQIIDEMPLRVSGGVATADINNDGYVDILFSLGDNQSVKLLINEGGIAFKDRTADYGLNNLEFRSSSPHFFNLNNDEYIDFIIGSVDSTPPQIFKNIKGKKFELQENPEFDILDGRNTITIQSVDFNNDGKQDLFLSHWLEKFRQDHFWENLGDGQFKSVDALLGFYSPFDTIDYTHNAKFLDLNGDNFDDLLLCSDFGTSQIWINESGVEFIYDKNHTLSDENAMGSAIGDFDNDGDYDWFVTSVYDNDGILEGNWGGNGNKFYNNDGTGNFTETSQELGVFDASWGWGTTFADLNNNGYQDIVVVNGWPQGSDQFKNDHLKLFISNKGDFFIESASELGLLDTLQGRGVGVLDYNRDGCLDIITSNYRGPVKLYKNSCKNENHYLSLSLWESNQNPFGEGCEIKLFSKRGKQLRTMSNSSNYVSQNPLEVHFGLKDELFVDSIKVYWNDNSTSVILNVEADQHLHIEKPITNNNLNDNIAKVYPNPVNTSISVIIDRPFKADLNMYIFNSSGIRQRVIKHHILHGRKTYFYDIDISMLPSGIYYLGVDEEGFNPIPFIKL